MTPLAQAQALVRAGAQAFDPATTTATPAVVRAWLAIQTVRVQPVWVAAASEAVQALELDTIPDDAVPAWVEACCLGWVQRASGPFRAVARRLLPRLPDDWRGAAARLGWWRITGEPGPLQAALRSLESPGDADAVGLGLALRLAWHATADEALRDRAAALLSPPLAAGAWGAAADLHDLDATAFADALAGADPADPDVVVGALALSAPPLHLDVHWHLADELREGPMAEAATFPWPALRLRFHPMDVRDQIRFEAHLADDAPEELEDVGVAAAWLASLVARVDRSPFLDGAAPPTRRRGGLRR